MAFGRNNEINYSSFIVENRWIWTLKKKIEWNCITENNEIYDTAYVKFDKLERIRNAILHDVKSIIKYFGEDNVCNADESGFAIEIHSGRTLANRVGTADQSWCSLTHSCDSVYNLRKWKVTLTCVYCVERVYWKEPRVQETLFKPSNIFI